MTAPGGKRGRVVSEAEFARLWADRSLTREQIGARLGIGAEAVAGRAKRRGLPVRPRGMPSRPYDRDMFRRMFEAGLRQADMATWFGVSEWTIRDRARKAGLCRPRGAPVIGLPEFAEMEMARRMAADTARVAA